MNINLPLQTILAVMPDVRMCTAGESLIVQAIKPLEYATANDLSVVFDVGNASVFDPVSLKAVEASSAGAVLSSVDVPGKPVILVGDVVNAYSALIAYVKHHEQATPAQVAASAVVHATAVVAEGAVIGDGAMIDALAYVGKRAKIGNRAHLHPGAKVLDDCVVDDDSIIQSNAVIGSDGYGYQVTRRGMRRLPHVGSVCIGKGVEIGANCMVDRALFSQTTIGDGAKLDNGVHVAHNVQIGPHTAILAQTGIAGSAKIGMGCQIGGQVAIKDHVTIGDGAKIVSKSAVMHDVAPGQTVCGIPAIPFTQWKRMTVALAKVPDLLKLAKEHTNQAGVMPAQKVKQWWHRVFGA